MAPCAECVSRLRVVAQLAKARRRISSTLLGRKIIIGAMISVRTGSGNVEDPGA